MSQPALWENFNVTWENASMPWEEVLIEVANLIRRGGGISEYIKGNPWRRTEKEIGKEKTEKFIKIFCSINNLEYEEMVNPEKKIKIAVGQIERVFKEGLKVSIKFD